MTAKAKMRVKTWAWSALTAFVIPAKPRETGDPVGHDARLPVEKPCVQAEPGSSAESRGVPDPRVREDDKRLCDEP